MRESSGCDTLKPLILFAKGEPVLKLEVEGVGTFEVEDGKRLVLAIEEDAGVDIIKVKELLGHRHVTTTQIYDKRRRSLKEGASHDVPI